MKKTWQSKLEFRNAAERAEEKVKVVGACIVFPVKVIQPVEVFRCILLKRSAYFVETVRGLAGRSVEAINPVHLDEVAALAELSWQRASVIYVKAGVYQCVGVGEGALCV